MDHVIEILNNYVDCCATCETFLMGRCGYVDKSISHPMIGEEEYYMMSSEEVQVYFTQLRHQPCETQVNEPTILKQVSEAIINADMELSEDWVLKLLSRLFEIKTKVELNNDTFKSTFLNPVDDAILAIIARVDLTFLQNRYDIRDLVEMAGFGYERLESLTKICPGPIIERYVSRANTLQDCQCEPHNAVDTRVAEVKEADSLPNKIEPASQTPHRKQFELVIPKGTSAIDEFITRFSGWPGKDPITALLIKAGYGDFVWGDMWDVQGITKEEWAEIHAEDWKRYQFNRWAELRTEISRGIKKRVNDELELKKYVCGLITPFDRFEYYASIKTDIKELVEAQMLINSFSDAFFFCSDAFIPLWKSVIETVRRKDKKKKLSIEKYQTAISKSLDKALMELSPASEEPEAEAFLKRREIQSYFPGLIEGCLLENGARLEYLDYQEMCGVMLIDKLDAFMVAHSMDWTEELVYSYNPQRVSKTILCTADEEEEKKEKDELGPYVLGKKTAAEHFIAIYSSDYLKNYIEATIAYLGFDPNMSFRKVEHMLSWYEPRMKEYHDGFKLPDFDRWAELTAEISDRVKNLKHDDCELTNYIFSLLSPLDEFCSYLYPNSKDSLRERGAFALKMFVDDGTYSLEEFKKQWRQAEDYVKTLPEYKNCSSEEFERMVELSFKAPDDISLAGDKDAEDAAMKLLDASLSHIGLPIIDGDVSVVSSIFKNLESYAAIIEAALLGAGIKQDLFYYQSASGVNLCMELNPSQIAFAMEWTIVQTETYIKKYNHRIEIPKGPFEYFSSGEKKEEPSVSFGDVSVLSEEFRTEKAIEIWEKAYKVNLIDKNFIFRGKKVELSMFAAKLSFALFGKIDWITIQKWNNYKYYAKSYGEVSAKPKEQQSERIKLIMSLF